MVDLLRRSGTQGAGPPAVVLNGRPWRFQRLAGLSSTEPAVAVSAFGFDPWRKVKAATTGSAEMSPVGIIFQRAEHDAGTSSSKTSRNRTEGNRRLYEAKPK